MLSLDQSFLLLLGRSRGERVGVQDRAFFWRLNGKPEKTKFISRIWAYHGTTMAAMSATGMPFYWPMFEPRVPGFLHIPGPYPYRFQPPAGTKADDPRTPGLMAADLLEETILRQGPETVAAFIGEPVQGSGGVIVPPDDYWPRIREICNRYDVLLLADEIITGFGRTGEWFGLSRYGVEPDIISFAKAITSGYFPLGGIGVNDRVAETINSAPDNMSWMHAYTYSAHPVGSAVALANLDIIEGEGLVERRRRAG